MVLLFCTTPDALSADAKAEAKALAGRIDHESSHRLVIHGRLAEVFMTLREPGYCQDTARILIEDWQKHYNQFRPHSSLGYRPPAPKVIQPALITATLTY